MRDTLNRETNINNSAAAKKGITVDSENHTQIAQIFALQRTNLIRERNKITPVVEQRRTLHVPVVYQISMYDD